MLSETDIREQISLLGHMMNQSTDEKFEELKNLVKSILASLENGNSVDHNFR